jgi:hypothetical protein
MMNNQQIWYVVLQANGACAIVSATEMDSEQPEGSQETQKWGPYDSQQAAIARRVGLIRAGKCKPV